jgi:hypothetical protein
MMTGVVWHFGKQWLIPAVAVAAVMVEVCADSAKPTQPMETRAVTQSILERVAEHNFHPIRDGFT